MSVCYLLEVVVHRRRLHRRRGFFYNVATAKILTVADIIVLIQMSTKTPETMTNNNNGTKTISSLSSLSIKDEICSSIHENFCSLKLQKFRILRLIDYSHIVYLDTNIMTVWNLLTVTFWKKRKRRQIKTDEAAASRTMVPGRVSQPSLIHMQRNWRRTTSSEHIQVVVNSWGIGCARLKPSGRIRQSRSHPRLDNQRCK